MEEKSYDELIEEYIKIKHELDNIEKLEKIDKFNYDDIDILIAKDAKIGSEDLEIEKLRKIALESRINYNKKYPLNQKKMKKRIKSLKDLYNDANFSMESLPVKAHQSDINLVLKNNCDYANMTFDQLLQHIYKIYDLCDVDNDVLINGLYKIYKEYIQPTYKNKIQLSGINAFNVDKFLNDIHKETNDLNKNVSEEEEVVFIREIKNTHTRISTVTPLVVDTNKDESVPNFIFDMESITNVSDIPLPDDEPPIRSENQEPPLTSYNDEEFANKYNLNICDNYDNLYRMNDKITKPLIEKNTYYTEKSLPNKIINHHNLNNETNQPSFAKADHNTQFTFQPSINVNSLSHITSKDLRERVLKFRKLLPKIKQKPMIIPLTHTSSESGSEDEPQVGNPEFLPSSNSYTKALSILPKPIAAVAISNKLTPDPNPITFPITNDIRIKTLLHNCRQSCSKNRVLHEKLQTQVNVQVRTIHKIKRKKELLIKQIDNLNKALVSTDAYIATISDKIESLNTDYAGKKEREIKLLHMLLVNKRLNKDNTNNKNNMPDVKTSTTTTFRIDKRPLSTSSPISTPTNAVKRVCNLSTSTTGFSHSKTLTKKYSNRKLISTKYTLSRNKPLITSQTPQLLKLNKIPALAHSNKISDKLKLRTAQPYAQRTVVLNEKRKFAFEICSIQTLKDRIIQRLNSTDSAPKALLESENAIKINPQIPRYNVCPNIKFDVSKRVSHDKRLPKFHYNSPLLAFKFYRFNPYVRMKCGARLSDPYFNHYIEDVGKIVCPFQLNGVCKDGNCQYQHGIFNSIPTVASLENIKSLLTRYFSFSTPSLDFAGQNERYLQSFTKGTLNLEDLLIITSDLIVKQFNLDHPHYVKFEMDPLTPSTTIKAFKEREEEKEEIRTQKRLKFASGIYSSNSTNNDAYLDMLKSFKTPYDPVLSLVDEDRYFNQFTKSCKSLPDLSGPNSPLEYQTHNLIAQYKSLLQSIDTSASVESVTYLAIIILKGKLMGEFKNERFAHRLVMAKQLIHLICSENSEKIQKLRLTVKGNDAIDLQSLSPALQIINSSPKLLKLLIKSLVLKLYVLLYKFPSVISDSGYLADLPTLTLIGIIIMFGQEISQSPSTISDILQSIISKKHAFKPDSLLVLYFSYLSYLYGKCKVAGDVITEESLTEGNTIRSLTMQLASTSITIKDANKYLNIAIPSILRVMQFHDVSNYKAITDILFGNSTTANSPMLPTYSSFVCTLVEGMDEYVYSMLCIYLTQLILLLSCHHDKNCNNNTRGSKRNLSVFNHYESLIHYHRFGLIPYLNIDCKEETFSNPNDNTIVDENLKLIKGVYRKIMVDAMNNSWTNNLGSVENENEEIKNIKSRPRSMEILKYYLTPIQLSINSLNAFHNTNPTVTDATSDITSAYLLVDPLDRVIKILDENRSTISRDMLDQLLLPTFQVNFVTQIIEAIFYNSIIELFKQNHQLRVNLGVLVTENFVDLEAKLERLFEVLEWYQQQLASRSHSRAFAVIELAAYILNMFMAFLKRLFEPTPELGQLTSLHQISALFVSHFTKFVSSVNIIEDSLRVSQNNNINIKSEQSDVLSNFGQFYEQNLPSTYHCFISDDDNWKHHPVFRI